ncbi:hypothetical protein D027_4495B, partial [Vibrio parahaemolyticus 861]
GTISPLNQMKSAVFVAICCLPYALTCCCKL